MKTALVSSHLSYKRNAQTRVYFIERAIMKAEKSINDGIKVAVLVDGGFYRKRAYSVLGDLTPEERADELDSYCKRHLIESINGVEHVHDLYRIFYYDCPPSKKNVFNPVKKNNDNLEQSSQYKWTNSFFKALKRKRKLALRLGELSDTELGYYLSPEKTKALLLGKLSISEITEKDLKLFITQKGVDMRIGLDIASLAYKHQVNQIVLISGDSDFVPAAKLARREGIDFILDPLGATIKDSLQEHIDGLSTRDKHYLSNVRKADKK